MLFAGDVCAQIGDDEPKYDDRVGQILREQDIKYEIDSDGDYRVVYNTGNERTQLAYIRSKTYEYRNLEIREIWSFAYRIEGDNIPVDVANTLLEDAFKKKLGAWGRVGDKAIFVVRISANADKESLVNALELAVQTADFMEEQFTGKTDEF